MIIVDLPQAVRGEQYMMRLIYNMEEAMIVLDHEMGCHMMDLCREMDAATEIDGMSDEDHDMGDRIYELILHLGFMKKPS